LFFVLRNRIAYRGGAAASTKISTSANTSTIKKSIPLWSALFDAKGGQ
jgi:hypothetical protein